MSSSLKRSVLKARYQKFCELWANEKLRQRYSLEDGQAIDPKQLLRKKPTFHQWVEAVRAKAIDLEPKSVVPDRKVQLDDTSWD